MAGGGGDNSSVSIDEVNAKVAQIQPPDPGGPMGWVYQDNRSEPGATGSALDNWYANQAIQAARSMAPQNPQELATNVTQAVVKNNAPGRLPDPDYDLLAKPGVDYAKLDWSPENISALATQRASDYLSDQISQAASQSRQLSQSQQDQLVAQRQAYETERLTTAAQGDQAARDQARQSLVAKLATGTIRFPAGSSLLALDDPENQLTTTAGQSALLNK